VTEVARGVNMEQLDIVGSDTCEAVNQLRLGFLNLFAHTAALPMYWKHNRQAPQEKTARWHVWWATVLAFGDVGHELVRHTSRRWADHVLKYSRFLRLDFQHVMSNELKCFHVATADFFDSGGCFVFVGWG